MTFFEKNTKNPYKQFQQMQGSFNAENVNKLKYTLTTSQDMVMF